MNKIPRLNIKSVEHRRTNRPCIIDMVTMQANVSLGLINLHAWKKQG